MDMVNKIWSIDAIYIMLYTVYLPELGQDRSTRYMTKGKEEAQTRAVHNRCVSYICYNYL